MIGYYIHHIGHGHLHRALAAVRHLPEPCTALSSRPADGRWAGRWIELPRDDAGCTALDPTAGGHLHWAPVHDPGLSARMGMIAEWIVAHRPRVMVVDLSIEVLTLVRLMGVPVVTVSLPGIRDDPAHRRGYELADAIVAPWPARFPELGPSLEPFAAKVHYVGAVSRYETGVPASLSSIAAQGRPRRVLSMTGTGGGSSTDDGTALPELPGWDRIDIGPGRWNPDPWDDICTADVIVTHAGLGALADVAIARRPAVVIPQDRPHHEQATTAGVLGWARLATVAGEPPTSPDHWRDLLDDAMERGGAGWHEWADGGGGRRMAEVIMRVARGFS